MYQVNWSLIIALYLFLAGVAAAAFYSGALAEIYSGGKYRRVAMWGNIIALPLIVVGLALLVVDLGRPLSFWKFILNESFLPMFNPSSVMSLGTWLLSVFSILLIINLVLFYVDKDSLRRGVSYVTMIFGVLVAGYTGVLLTSTSATLWHATPFLGMLFLFSATSTGVAVLMLAVRFRNDADEELLHLLGKADAKVIVLEILAFVALLVGLAIWAPSALWTIAIGSYAVAFWLGIVVVGLIAPLAIEYSAVRSGRVSANSAYLSATLVLVGGFLMRYVILLAGQSG
ncbi:MAG: polysulfide reductase NrfD [Firmicutes bacterium]|nr:polysulfide reductase NrfD [Bacillota bacterium]